MLELKYPVENWLLRKCDLFYLRSSHNLLLDFAEKFCAV